MSIFTFIYSMHRVCLTNCLAKLWRSNSGIFHRKWASGISIKDRYTLIYGRDVVEAKKNRLPIVALESTIITHGMPYPDNLNTALKVEDVIRKQVRTTANFELNFQIYNIFVKIIIIISSNYNLSSCSYYRFSRNLQVNLFF